MLVSCQEIAVVSGQEHCIVSSQLKILPREDGNTKIVIWKNVRTYVNIGTSQEIGCLIVEYVEFTDLHYC